MSSIIPAEPAEPAQASPAENPDRGRGRRALGVALALIGLLLAAGGGTLLARELTRPPTKAEIAAALATEIATRWERLPAGTIFPATLTYQDANGVSATATRAGIARPARCRSALEPAAMASIRGLGCLTVLRATYAGGAGTLAVTVGVAVFGSIPAAQRAQGDLQPMQPGSGLYAIAYAGTITAGFGDAQRAAAGAQIAGPYLFLYTAGETDGMPGKAAAASVEPAAFGASLLTPIEKALTQHTSACAQKDIQC